MKASVQTNPHTSSLASDSLMNAKRVLILTALPEEHAAVRLHLPNASPVVLDEGYVCEKDKFSTASGDWSVAIVQTTRGNASASHATEAAFRYFKPHLAIFMGVAGSIKDADIGDVVVASRVYYYEIGKEHADKIENLVFTPRPRSYEAPVRLIQRSLYHASREAWKQLVPNDTAVKSKIYVEPIASGERLVGTSSGETSKIIKEHFSDAIAVDMESYGFAFAVDKIQHLLSTNKSEAIVVRGISDTLDDQTGPDNVELKKHAAAHAAAFSMQLLSELPVATDIENKAAASSINSTWIVTLEGEFANFLLGDIENAVAELGRYMEDDTLKIKSISKGSIRLHFEGKQSSYDKIVNLHHSGNLDKLLSHKVISITTENEQKIARSAKDEPIDSPTLAFWKSQDQIRAQRSHQAIVDILADVSRRQRELELKIDRNAQYMHDLINKNQIDIKQLCHQISENDRKSEQLQFNLLRSSLAPIKPTVQSDPTSITLDEYIGSIISDEIVSQMKSKSSYCEIPPEQETENKSCCIELKSVKLGTKST